MDSFDKRLEKIEKETNDVKVENENENLPTSTLEWIAAARPYVGKVRRTFEWEPFWPGVYEDPSPNIVVVNGRQTHALQVLGQYVQFDIYLFFSTISLQWQQFEKLQDYYPNQFPKRLESLNRTLVLFF